MGRSVSALLLLLLCLTAPPRLCAQPSERAERLLAELAVDLRHEAIERVRASILERLERVAPDKAPPVREKAVTRAFARRHLETDAETMLRDLFAEELRAGRLSLADLKFDLHLHRAYEKAWKVRDFSDRVPEHRTGFSPPRRSGYPAEVAAIDPRAPHSMHDLRDYLADRFTLSALNRAVADGAKVEIHLGEELDATSDLRNRGYRVLGEVKSPKGNYERILIAEGPRGDIRYVITGDIGGMDRVRHLSALLRFAGADGRGVASRNVEIVGDPEAIAERSYRALRTGLERMGVPGDRAIIGFRGALKSELTERALARRGAEHLRDVLGAAPYEGLLRRLRAEHQRANGARRARLGELIAEVDADSKLASGLRVSPARAFSATPSLKRLKAAEKTLVDLAARYPEAKVLGELVADGKLRLPGGVSAKGFGVTRPLEFGTLRAEELRVRGPGGRVESVKLLNNYYGDTMGTVVRALLDTGHTRLAYFGTAGGTGEGVRVGDVHVPRNVYDFRGELASRGLRNAFLDYFEGRSSPLGKRLRTGTELSNVFSPAEETMSWLERTRARGIDAIEVENSYIAREVARYNNGRPARSRASLHTAVIISDVPGSELTLGNNNGATTSTFEKMVDHYLEAMGIRDLELVDPAEARRPGRPLARSEARRLALDVAEKLIPRARSKSSFLRDRLAALLEPLGAEVLARIDAKNARRLRPADVEGLDPSARRTLEAEVAGAYTDADLVTSLRRGDALLSRLASELRARHPRARYELRVGGGLERGAYSPVAGLVLEVRGSPTAARSAAELLERLRAEFPGAPRVRLAEAGPDAVSLGRGEVFARQPRPLTSELYERALRFAGANHHGTRVEYPGREHDPTASPSELFSRYEAYATGPAASEAERLKFERLAARHGARVEYVPSSDPRLRGGQGRTLLDADGRALVLLPSDRPLRKFALLDELTHLRQIERMRTELGARAVRELFDRAASGDPAATAKMIAWEIKAKRMVRMTLAAEDPNRAMLDREIERLRRVLDPYLDVRRPDGRIDWERARRAAKNHAAGAASFLLGLFLKDLARVIESGDRAVIEAFFDGLATTEFWSEYGLFVIGAEAGTLAYTRFLQRFVRPAFVSNVLKANVALATGMALPAIVRGRFDGKTYAINLTGLMLSSTAVKAGLAALRWVVPLGRLSRYRGLSRLLNLARGVPGWIYSAAELAVVLYFGEEISAALGNWEAEREARGEVAARARGLLDAAARAEHADDPRLRRAIEGVELAFAAWRDRALAPALEATRRLNERVAAAGREATHMGLGVSRFHSLASRYPHLTRHVERSLERSDRGVEAAIDEALGRFARERKEALEAAYEKFWRASAYDPRRDPDEVSENRLQAYEDEALLYEAAAEDAASPEVAARLREAAALAREIARREAALLAPTRRAEPTPTGRPGAAGVLEGATRER
ncbi:MAG: hypothetical protein D6731_17195 [Planctomycetota bacterium]|nr:MAG: hypothetical protein D6731_17195 [Planctomycetota bacterium]